MIEDFANLVKNHAQTHLYDASIAGSEKTQQLLDEIWKKVNDLE